MPNPNTPPGEGVTLNGNAVQNGILTALSTITDTDGLGPLSWQWQRQTGSAWAAIQGATDPSYTPWPSPT